MRARLISVACLAFGLLAAGGCDSPPAEPLHPAWADVAPIFRGACNGCHGWTAPQTGNGYRFDFYDVTTAACGDAALAIPSTTPLAGSPGVGMQIVNDVLPSSQSPWPRMPPQPCPALPDWERDTIERWAVMPVRGLPPPGNQPPTLSVSQYPATVDKQLSFIAVIDDADGDSVIGVIEVNGEAFLMNRPGSFAVSFDSSTWPTGSAPTVSAVLCDGWVSTTVPDLGTVVVKH